MGAEYMDGDLVRIVSPSIEKSLCLVGQVYKCTVVDDVDNGEPNGGKRLKLDISYCPYFDFEEVKLYRRPFWNRIKALFA